MQALVGVVLAGGRATRMGGGDKGALVLGGRALFDRVIDRLGPQVEAVAINANGPPARLAEYGLPVLPDSVPDQPGPLAGVLAALDWAAARRADLVITVAADTPFFPTDLALRLERAARRSGTPIALAATEEEGRLMRHPTFGLYPCVLRHDLRRALGQGVRRMQDWTDRHGAASTLFASEAFFNINTPEDLARAEALLAGQA